jgi:hypothetical protein
LRVNPLVSSIPTASLRNSSVRFSPIVHLLCCSKCYQRSGIKPPQVQDDFNREGLGIEVDFSLPAGRVIRSLNRFIEWRGKPETIRVDNGPDYISAASC